MSIKAIDSMEEKKETATYIRFANIWAGSCNFIFSNMAAVIRAGQTSVNFCNLSCTFVFQSVAVPSGRFSNPPTSASSVRCALL